MKIRAILSVAVRHLRSGGISIHPPRAERDKGDDDAACESQISIRPPRAGWDDYAKQWALRCALISIRPPRAGRDSDCVIAARLSRLFQSTRPCGVGLRETKAPYGMVLFQSARPVRGGTAYPPQADRGRRHFNPPAPCGAGHSRIRRPSRPTAFQSARPVRGGTAYPPQADRGRRHFNPPAPCGAGLAGQRDAGLGHAFQSARPVRGGTEKGVCLRSPRRISIRPPRAGRDSNSAQNFFCAGLHNAQFNDCAGLAAHLLQPSRCNFSGYSSILRCEPTGVHL